MQQKTTAAVVVSDSGYILPYTVKGTKSAVDDYVTELWGDILWQKLQDKGARIAQCEITLLD